MKNGAKVLCDVWILSGSHQVPCCQEDPHVMGMPPKKREDELNADTQDQWSLLPRLQ